MAKPEGDHAQILKSGRWKEAVQAYLATISFCDAMVGRLIDGLMKSEHRDNTLVVLWGDHGWHLGEKHHWRKFALWEESTRTPYIYVVPGLTKAGGVCDRPVDLMSVYPTLCDLAGITPPSNIEGISLRPLLADPKAPWDRPALTTFHLQNHSLRSDTWRYIRYANGDEELYNHDSDPYGWTNLASDPKYTNVKLELARFFPTVNQPELPRTADGEGAKPATAKKKNKNNKNKQVD
jgi:arylsulfatase A-like enzyme